MKTVEKTGRTVEEAVEAALKELDASRDQCEIEILDEGNKGFLGLLGGKPARVRVTLRESAGHAQVEQARAFLEGVLSRMGLVAAVETRTDEDGVVHMNITGSELGTIIGRRGQTLDALQYLVNVVGNRQAAAGSGSWVRIVLDAEGYRERRAETLRQLAHRMAEKAVARGRRIRLEPMSAHERRVVHLALKDHPKVETQSDGEEPFRRVIIVPKH